MPLALRLLLQSIVRPTHDVRCLISCSGAEPTRMPALAGDGSALHWVIVAAGLPLILALVAAGADPDQRDEQGQTPLMAFLHVNNRPGLDRLAKLWALLTAGATAGAPDGHGWTPLHHAGWCAPCLRRADANAPTPAA